MANPVPVCAHVKTDGVRCGSPAVSGSEFCYHHSAVKTTLGKAPSGKAAYGAVTPIPFLFPEDRASIQVNYFLLFQAFMDERIKRSDADLMFRMLKEMRVNLGKTGSLVDQEPTSQKRDVGHPPVSGEVVSDQGNSGKAASDKTASNEAVSLQASAAEIFPGPIAPESCFSTTPPQVGVSGVDLFRVSTLDLAGGGLRRGARPVAR